MNLLVCSARLAWAGDRVPHEVRGYRWTHGVGQPLKDLQDFRHLRRKAEELAAEVRSVTAESPRRPVYLVGRSGGAGLVLAAAELLPPATLERIVLLSAAVSPDCDLTAALLATRGGIVSYYSELDQAVLNWGTRQFGTADRVYGPSAGVKGFAVPDGHAAGSGGPYDRLVQIPWRPRMLWRGHGGLHSGTLSPWFLRSEVAPWLQAPPSTPAAPTG
jgi:hypothetical protein